MIQKTALTMVEQMVKTRTQSLRITLTRQLFLLAGMIALIWCVEILDWLVWRNNLDQYGVEPRTLLGLRNIFFAPFLHDGFGHLVANTLPFLVLAWLVLLRGVRDFVIVSMLAGVVSGLGIWLLAMPGTIHLGLSGVIFGYLGFLLLRAYFEQSIQAFMIAILVGFLYGGMLWGVLPIQQNISWLGHLFGFVGGSWAARLLSKPLNRP